MATNFARFLALTTTLSLGLLTGVVLLSCASTAIAQNKADEGYVAVITGDNVNVRSGASDSYYTFSKVSNGDLVQVMGEKILDEKSRWARVATTGPAFRNAFGYVRYAKTDVGKVRLSDDGQTALTLGRIDIIAPNMDMNGAAKDSWKPLVRLEADQPLRVLEKTETDKDTILKVALPDGAQGWISLSFVRKADTTEIAQFKSSLNGESLKPAVPQPTEVVRTSTTPPAATPSAQPTGNGVAESTPPSTDASTNAISMGHSPGTPTQDSSTSTPDTTSNTNAGTGETTGEVAADTNAVTTPTAPTKTAPAPARLPTLEDLEGAYKLLQKEPIATAEVIPLRDMYLELGKRHPSDKRIMRYVSARSDQLQVWADLQKRQQDLADMRSRLNSTVEEADAARKALESSAQYTAVGRIAASTIYDGEGLPKLLRLQDGATGRTVAYLQPDEEFRLVNLIGNLVGIVGEKSYDGSLRLNIIDPSRIDILTTEPQADTQMTQTPTQASTPTQAVNAETPSKP